MMFWWRFWRKRLNRRTRIKSHRRESRLGLIVLKLVRKSPRFNIFCAHAMRALPLTLTSDYMVDLGEIQARAYADKSR